MPDIRKSVSFDIASVLSKMGIEEGQQTAELGCGNFGFFVFPLARLVGRRGKVYAVDVLPSALQEIKKTARQENLPQVVTVWSNLEIFKATQIETNSLDGAFLVNVIHQSEKRVEIIREAVRLLKRGGKLLIIEWKNAELPFGPEPDRRVKIEAIRAAAPKLGLAIREEFEVGSYHYGIILTKL